MENKLKTIEKFFKYNIELKIEINKIYPNSEYSYSNETAEEYKQKLYSSLEIMKYYITSILISFKFEQYMEFVNNTFDLYYQQLDRCNSDYYKLKDFYIKNIGNLDEKLNYELNMESFGYSISDPSYILKKAKTVNEMLHILHHVIINNEKFYNNIPILGEQNNEKNKVILYGKENKFAQSIYEQIPSNLESDQIDILSLNNKIVIMARDIGHALSIEIDINGEKCLVTYFIPKICNYMMVNNLKGVNPVTKDSDFTTGMFMCKTDNLSFEIVKFMENVPTDDDIITNQQIENKHTL